MNISPNKLVIKRLLKHARERVFSALTDPAQMAKWFYGMDSGWAEVTSDLRPGGNYEIKMFNLDGTLAATPYGRYLEIVPPEKVAFTWMNTGFVKETTVTIELFKREEGTELVLTHDVPADAFESHKEGWNNCVDHLDILLR